MRVDLLQYKTKITFEILDQGIHIDVYNKREYTAVKTPFASFPKGSSRG